MGKKLTEVELKQRLLSGDLKDYFNDYLKSNEFISIIHNHNGWFVTFKCSYCNKTYQRSIDKIKRFQQCSTTECKVRRQKETNFKLYGDENYNNLDKMKQTKLKKYGDTFGNRDKIKDSISKLDRNSISDKMIQTKQLKYGSTLCNNVEQMKNTWRNSMQNNLSNISTWEQEALDKLKSKFHSVKFNYYDKERYPYLCDFYIEDIDTFIELNYHWSHGNEPYKATPQQLKIIKEWVHKGWYSNIKVWTVKDVQKRTTALTNKLNYKEFFSKSEFNKWFNSL